VIERLERLRRRPGAAQAAKPARSTAVREQWLLRRVRLRLTAWYVSVLLLILLVLGAAVFVAIERSLAAETDRALRAAAAAQVERLEQNGSRVTPPAGEQDPTDPDDAYAADAGDIFVYVVDAQGRIVANPRAVQEPGLPNTSGIATALAGGTDLRTANSGKGQVRVLTVPLAQGGAVQVGRSLNARGHELYEIELALALIAIVGLGLATAGGFLLSGRALRPVREGFVRQRAFVADASHELRAPLTLIRATAETLGRGAARRGDDDAPLYADLVDEADRLGRLVSDLLLLAQLDEARLRVKWSIVDLGQVIEQSTQRITPLLGGRTLSVERAPEHPLFVHGDAERLGQILFILLDNAVKHTPEDTTIRLTAWRSHGRVVVTVTDNGPGLPADVLAHAFDRFYRGDSAHGREGGAGLGLAIARGLAEALGGALGLSRPAAGGLRATLRLPAIVHTEG
jgi:signal transduction histidine kinase